MRLTKRQLLKTLAGALGAGVASQLISGKAFATAINYETQKVRTKKSRKVFTYEQMQVLANICAVVLPETDTPSAAELGVHGFIDHQLFTCYDIEQQQQTKAVINTIEQQSMTHYSSSFNQMKSEQQTELLVALEGVELGFTSADKTQFAFLKSLLVFGYFTTEVGATQALNYQAVPGEFKGSIPYDSIGKSYGALAYY